MNIVYEKKKAAAQRYVARERNRIRNFKNRLSAGLRRLPPNSIHVFEDLDKGDFVSRKRLRSLGGRGVLEHPGGAYIEECRR